MFARGSMNLAVAALALVASSSSLINSVSGYRVGISDTDELREVCSGMFGGKEAYIELTFDSSSAGQLALVIYEWNDVSYLGAESGSVAGSSEDYEMPKTYICTTSAVRSGLCTKSSLGQFITTLPPTRPLNTTSIFTTSLKFNANSFPVIDEFPTPESDEDLPVLDELESSSSIAEIAPGGALETGKSKGNGGEEAAVKPTSTKKLSPTTTAPSKTKTKTKTISKPTNTAIDSETVAEEEAELEEELAETIEDDMLTEELEEEIAEEEFENEIEQGVPEEVAEENYEETVAEEILEDIEFEGELAEIIDEEEAELEAGVQEKRLRTVRLGRPIQERTLPRLNSGFAAGQHSNKKRSLPVGIKAGLAAGLYAPNNNDKRGLFGFGSSKTTTASTPTPTESEDELVDEYIEAVDTGDYEEAEVLYDEIAEVEGIDPETLSGDDDGQLDGVPFYDGALGGTTSSDYENGEIISEATTSSAGSNSDVPTYEAPIVYAVPKTGYYCIGVVPVTLVNSKRDSIAYLQSRQTATHAEYSGSVLFRNTFDGELPAAEYPKIGFYFFLSIVYVALAAGWGFLCFQHYRDLLPMQYYISGTIVFLVIEMLANWGYYRYINKHGGGAGSLAFLVVVAVLNAGRNSLSFFLLLIVSMGLSVVTPSLGAVMNRVYILTGMHFVFGVLYAIGVVKVELETASLFLVLFLIFPLALTMTAFLMWTIISLNGTIMHLAARKQRHKLALFKTLYRTLMVAAIAVAGFFVVSSLSLSNRLEEDYAPKSWRYRWVLLDGSLATIYLCVFTFIAWLWRPSRDSARFAMSQELAQDEADADAEDYEIDNLEAARGHRGNFDDDGDESAGFISKEGGNGHSNGGIHLAREDERDANVVFAIDDEEDADTGGIHSAEGYGNGNGYKRD